MLEVELDSYALQVFAAQRTLDNLPRTLGHTSSFILAGANAAAPRDVEAPKAQRDAIIKTAAKTPLDRY